MALVVCSSSCKNYNYNYNQ